MNKERDKFLTEAMGECWHKFSGLYCIKCHAYEDFDTETKRNDFSTWEGFGKLWEWSKSQSWYKALEWRLSDTDAVGHIAARFVDPDLFADKVYSFLKEN